METNLTIGIFVIGIVLLIVIGICSYIADKKRREALRALAAKLGLSFNESKNYDLATQYSFLNKLSQGYNRYLFNTFSGVYRGEQVLISDYHYETYSTDSKGHRQTHHHYFSMFTLQLPATFPELTVTREGFLSKIAQALGYDDIDFESHEFSRNFCVRSRDKKFAYDICNARMIEYLLKNQDLSIEIEHNILALVFESKTVMEQIEMNLNRLLEIRSLMPDYLFTRI
ncbi:MAG: hypothetical protein PHR77_11280 [Kiritimatiellae bacterium]|nr:hypothetical protein [Kiritimatiellia bacterium]MDD5520267.1 hypothetical protein [Kiritimatiellia bacterium]